MNKKAIWTFIFVLLFVGIGALRLFYCTQLPINTGDLPRHIYHGLYANQHGIDTAGKTLSELDPKWEWVAWSDVKYNYPILTFLFFMLIAKISPTLFFAKLALTIIEAFNTLLIYKYSKDRLLAFLFWISPVSVWWVSHEGQFEPLQSLFMIGALCLLRKRPTWAFLTLALAIQVKLTAILMLPYFVFTGIRYKKLFLTQMVFFITGFLPSIVAQCIYPMMQQVIPSGPTFSCSPYRWNVFDKTIYAWNPAWMVVLYQLMSYVLLGLFLWGIIKWREIKSWLAPTAFIIFCKTSPITQPWYFILYQPFLLPIKNRRWRLWLFALVLLLDLTSLIEIFSGPFGYTVGGYYQYLTVFTRLQI